MNQKPKIVLAGGSGFLGNRLAQALLARGYEIVNLGRGAKQEKGFGASRPDRRQNAPDPSTSRVSRYSHHAVRQVYWDGKNVGPWTAELEGAVAVVNLTGKNVNCRYTPENREEIISSRVDSVKVIAAALRQIKNPPKVWVQASSLAIYGNPGETVCTENSPHSGGFPPIVCTQWENALATSAPTEMRTVVLRIGFVLDKGRGAMAVLEKLTRWFLGGSVGTGRQWISWIHWQDMNEMFLWAIEKSEITGAYNATSPNPVTNAAFMKELRSVLHRPWCPPAPEFAARLGAWFMGTEASLALQGRRCVPEKFEGQGFTFRFGDVRAALEDCYRNRNV